MANKQTRKNGKPKSLSFQVQALIGILAIIVVVALLYLAINGNGKAETQAAETAPMAEMTYNAPPEMTIDLEKTYLAVFSMQNGGKFTVQLFPDKAPLAVNSFVFLAREGYYNGVTFHRVLDGFMAQGGDRSGTGAGGPGYTFINEDSDLTFDKPGVMAMANAGRDTNGSQFFITFQEAENLNGDYTIFGQVIDGMEVVNKITRRNPEQNPNFVGDVITNVEIIEK